MRLLRRLQDQFERYSPAAGRWLPLVGGGLLLLAAVFWGRSWMVTRGRVRTVATVTENASSFAKQGGVVYTPRLRFQLPTGEWMLVEAGPGSEDIEYEAGETVPVMYRAGDPHGAVIATVWRVYSVAIVLGLWGTALFDLGWAVRVMMRKKRAA